MNWKALKDGCCPKCENGMLRRCSAPMPPTGMISETYYECDKQCRFSIRESRLKEIITSTGRSKRAQQEALDERSGWERFES